jgi:hypothetical protein
MRYRALPWLLLVLLATLMFALACRLVPPAPAPGGRPGQSSMAGRLFTASRVGLGGAAVERADLYLHCGLESAAPGAFSNTWFQRMGEKVAVRDVAHRGGHEAREVVPWLWFAASLDPDNIDNTLMAVYWLKVAGRDDLAMGALREALGRHPRSSALHLERARLLLRRGDIATATRALDAGLVCAPAGAGGNTNVIRGVLSTYRALIFEYEGDTNGAIACLAASGSESPEALGRLAALRENRPAPVPAAVLISNLVQEVHHCEAHGDEHDEADHADGNGRPH